MNDCLPADLSELSIHALAWAGRIAEWYTERVTVLHAVPTFEPMEVRAGALYDRCAWFAR